MNYSILKDCFRYSNKVNKLTVFKTKRIHMGFKYTYELRKVQNSNNKLIYLLHRYRLLKLSKKYGFQINPSAKIGEGLYLGHRGTVIVNGESILGNNINIMPGVTIGQENRGKRKGVPIIGNCVWIGGNSTIVGKINIGNDVLIAPNTFVNIDVPDHSIVIGNPATIIHRDYATDGYIQNKVK